MHDAPGRVNGREVQGRSGEKPNAEDLDVTYHAIRNVRF